MLYSQRNALLKKTNQQKSIKIQKRYESAPQRKKYRSHINFSINKKNVKISDGEFEPDLTLLDYLRKSAHLTGAKLTCGEGGCGACTVMLTYERQGEVVNRAFNSCLVPIGFLDGKEVTTVEGIGSVDRGLNIVQEKIAECFGSQCGFCTPGFVMSLYSCLKRNPVATEHELLESIDGNLCRCTGYRSIVEAIRVIVAEIRENPLTKDEVVAMLQNDSNIPIKMNGSRSDWYVPNKLKDLLELKKLFPNAKIVVGNTEIGIEQRFLKNEYPVLIDPSNVESLSVIKSTSAGMKIGAAVTLSEFGEFLQDKKKTSRKSRHRTLDAILEQLELFSGPSIRNGASLAGNIMTASPISDLNTLLIATNSEFTLNSKDGGVRVVPAREFFTGYRKTEAKPEEILQSIYIPYNTNNQYVKSYKQSRRRKDDIAIVNAGMSVKLAEGNIVEELSLSFGGMAPKSITAPNTELYFKGRVWSEVNFKVALDILHKEIKLDDQVPGGMGVYRTTLALSFFYKFFIEVTKNVSKLQLQARDSSAVKPLITGIPKGIQTYQVTDTILGQPVKHSSSLKQTSGEAEYTDDIPSTGNELFGSVFTSTVPHGKIISIDTNEALKVPGVQGIFTHKDIPGSNIIGDIIKDEHLFAEDHVTAVGELIGIVAADTEYAARKAARLVKVVYEELEPILSIEDAIAKESFFDYNTTIISGDVDSAFKTVENIIEGEFKLGGQEHFYFEPNVTLAVPTDNEMLLYTSTQNLNKTQMTVSEVLGIQASKVTAKLRRLGGGFGGKETFNIPFSCAAAVAANKLKKPVRLLLQRDEDMKLTGKRHPFIGKYKVGYDNSGKIVSADVMLYNNGGNVYDLSGPVLDRAKFHIDNAYNIPNLRVGGRICKTNIITPTAFRGFGGPQGMFMIESIIERIAEEINIPSHKIRKSNLYKSSNKTHYGMKVNVNMDRLWSKCMEQSNFKKLVREKEKFNEKHRWKKRGISIIPAKFGLAFTATLLNQGTALVNIYTDGTVSVTHGGTEMGQGLHTKVIQVVANELKVSVDDVYITDSDTSKIPNASATAASMGSDIYCQAAINACKQLNASLAPFRKNSKTGLMKDIALDAYVNRTSLQASGYHTVPVSGFDFDKQTGQPFHYFTSGCCVSYVEVDILTGDFKTISSDIVMDVGTSINPMIDIGQIEGAFIQGLGWMTFEELAWGDKGHIWLKPGHHFASGPGNYKIPSVDDIPLSFNVTLAKGTKSPAVHSSRGIGEPPICLSAAVPFAIRDAVKSARTEEGLTSYFNIDAPYTSERIRMACPDFITNLTIPSNYKPLGSW